MRWLLFSVNIIMPSVNIPLYKLQILSILTLEREEHNYRKCIDRLIQRVSSTGTGDARTLL